MSWSLIQKQEEFLHSLEKQGKSFNTIKNYKADLHCFNQFLLLKDQHLKIKSFSSLQVQEYAQYLDDKYPSSNSVRRRVQALRIFFDFLMIQGAFPENPLKKMPVSPKVLDQPSPNSLDEVIKTYHHLKKRFHHSTGEIQELVAARNIIIFHLIYGSSLKVSDLSKLRMGSIIQDKLHYRVMVEHPKRDPYSVPLPKAFHEDFLLYKNKFQHHLQKTGQEIEELLFNANPFKILSGGLSPRGTELMFEELGSELEIKITAKSLRQSCIFKWLSSNIPHSTIKEWLGVTPSYSLELYLEELKKDPAGKIFKDLDELQESKSG